MLLFLLHHCRLSCRYAMFQKSVLVNQNWEAQAAVRGERTPPPSKATALLLEASTYSQRYIICHNF